VRQRSSKQQFSAEAAVLLECLEITLVFALTCSAVLLFLRSFDQDPTAPTPPERPWSPPDRP
jgi:hypothetical protein